MPPSLETAQQIQITRPATRTAPQATTLLVIPTYNERDNIERLVREIQQRELGLDLLIIDDNSPDGTGAVADEFTKQWPVTVIHRKKKLGIGSAHQLGFQYAIEQQYPYVMTMDADFTHSSIYLRPIMEQATSADIVIGSRYAKGGGMSGWGLHRLLVTRTAHWFTTHVLRMPYDCTGGFRLYRTAVLQRVDFRQIRSEGYAFLFELLFHLAQGGWTIREVPIVVNVRSSGKSKISWRDLLRAVQTLHRLSRQRRLTSRAEASQ